jgi:hypothetical protein
MTERPIMCGPLVRAILDGAKTQTRRVVKPQPPEILPSYAPKVYWPDRDRHMTWAGSAAYLQFERPGDYDGQQVMRGGFGFRCPYGQPGDRLWVRETWRSYPDGIVYRADYRDTDFADAVHAPWRASIHMPRSASRIALEVTGVRVELLQDITEEDAMAEGVEPELVPPDGGSVPHVEGYRRVWEGLHGAGAWDLNPWVWVVSFVRVKP